jgi:hypothetical protein
MAHLSTAERSHYQTQGWLVPQFRLSQSHTATMPVALNELIRRNPGVRPEKLVSAQIERAGNQDNGEGVRGVADFLQLAKDPDIVELVSDVIGNDVIIWGAHVFCKPAGDGYETPWHQDGHYWPIRPLATCTVWVPLEQSVVN